MTQADRTVFFEIERSQAALRRSIEQSKRLAEKSQQLLDRSRHPEVPEPAER